MRNASHRSICRLRRAARRVGGRQEGVAGRDPSQGSPVPSSTPTPTPQENPQPGTPTRPQSPRVLGPATPHIPCAPSQGVHLCLGALTSLHSSVHLPRSICLSLCVCLSFSGCVACFSRVLSFHECLPISLCPPVSPASPCPPVFSLPAPWVFSSLHLPLPFFRSICHPSVPLSFCPRGSCLCLSYFLYPSLLTNPSSLCPTVSLSLLLSAHCLWGRPLCHHLSLSFSALVPVSMSSHSLPLFRPGSQSCLPTSLSLSVSTCLAAHVCPYLSVCLCLCSHLGLYLCLPFPGFLA